MSATFAIYLLAFVGPFVQEDAAIIAAATAFLHPETLRMASAPLLLVSMFVGLVVSDLWKYWIGWAGRQNTWAAKMAQKPAVHAAKAEILKHTGKALMIARFVPGTRIPAYIASGYFGVPFHRFAFWVVVSAGAYVGVAITLLASVGAVAGQRGLILVGATLAILLLLSTSVSLLRKRFV
jgi:membrane protein DedA with SNARE-associated domain